MKRAIVFAVVFLLLAGLVGGFAYFQFFIKPEMVRGAVTGGAQPPATVAAEPARTESWRPKLPAIGTFRAIEGIELAPQVDGIVSAIHFESGQEIEAGSLLVELDDSIEQADLKSGIAQLKKSELDLARQRELLERGNTPKTNYDAALAARDTAAATVDRTRAVIAQKKILAPFSGRLGLREVDLGQYVSPGTKLVTLQRLDPIYLDFPMPEQDIGVLRVGQETEARVDAYPDALFTGRIASIDARVNQESRTILVRAEIDNPDRRLLPGMFANVSVLAGEPQEVVTVPRTAISYSLYGDSVYVVKPAEGQDGEQGADRTLIAQRRFVQVGTTRDGRVAISEGVEAGEQVVIAGQIKLQPDARVTIDNSQPLEAPAERPKQ